MDWIVGLSVYFVTVIGVAFFVGNLMAIGSDADFADFEPRELDEDGEY